jgi:hypothetical protein
MQIPPGARVCNSNAGAYLWVIYTFKPYHPLSIDLSYFSRIIRSAVVIICTNYFNI